MELMDRVFIVVLGTMCLCLIMLTLAMGYSIVAEYQLKEDCARNGYTPMECAALDDLL